MTANRKPYGAQDPDTLVLAGQMVLDILSRLQATGSPKDERIRAALNEAAAKAMAGIDPEAPASTKAAPASRK